MRLAKVLVIILTIAGLVGLIGAVTYLYLFYPRPCDSFELNSPNQPRKILLVRQGSDFKSALVKELCDSLSLQQVYIRGIDIDELSTVTATKWDKILVVTTFMVQLNRQASRFIETSSPENLLLLVTSGGNDWQPRPDLKVDAITSASRMDNIGELIPMLLEWVVLEDSTWEPTDQLLALKYFPAVEVVEACREILIQRHSYYTRYPDLRRQLNQAGYYQLRLKNPAAAVEIFRLNVRLFPESWNTYDSLGEALAVQGKREAARLNYRRALELNPRASSPRKALKRLGIEPSM